MRVVVTNDIRLAGTSDGAVWAPGEGSSFYERYLTAFDEVMVLARVRPIDRPPPDWKRVDQGPIRVTSLPYYHGLREYIAHRGAVLETIRRVVRPDDAGVARTGTIGSLMATHCFRDGRPYGLEVVGDPYDVFSPRAVRHPLRPLLRWWTPLELRRLCRRATAVSYVTQHALQQRYPASQGAYTTHYSSISLPVDDFVQAPRDAASFQNETFRLSFAGSLDQMYKGPDVLIDALARCVRGGLDLTLVMMGEGRHRGEVEAIVREHAMEDRVRMTGYIAAKHDVLRAMDESDLFVLPSRMEGLPRVIIEAMARALPCLGTRIGGIPELLPEDCLVPKDDPAALADAIAAVVSDPKRAAAMSARNLQEAAKYREDVLAQRRARFYRYIRNKTRQWLEA